jgi:hypothetical protein
MGDSESEDWPEWGGVGDDAVVRLRIAETSLDALWDAVFGAARSPADRGQVGAPVGYERGARWVPLSPCAAGD